jgi:Phage portal protein/Phage Mu protein F like protein
MRYRAPSRAIDGREIRDPTAATVALRFTSPGRYQIDTWDAQRAIDRAYYANVFVYRCAQVIAWSLMRLPWRMGADPDRPLDFDRNHPFARMMGPGKGLPAKGIPARQLWAWSITQLLITGKLGWEIERGARDVPIAFWPLPASHLRGIPTVPKPGQRTSDYFAGFEYGDPSKPRRLRPEQVFYHWHPSQNDWRQPESVLQAARLPISTAVMQDRYDYAFLNNNAMPAAVVVHGAFAEKAEKEAWRNQFLAESQGPDRAGSVIFSEVESDGEGGVGQMVDVKPLGLSQRDSMAVERYAQTIRAVTVAFGTPLSILGDAANRTFSNAGTEMEIFWDPTMLAHTTDLADAVNAHVAPLFPGDLVGWFDLSRVKALKPAPKFASIDPLAAAREGVLAKDEIREDLGYPPLPDGEGAVAEVVAVPAQLPTTAAASRPSGQARTAARNGDGSDSAPSDEGPVVDHEARRTGIYRSIARSVKGLELLWARQWRAMFRRQELATLRRLQGRRGRGQRDVSPGDIFDEEFWTNETIDFSTGLYEAVFAEGGARVSDLFGLDFDMDAPYVADFIDARANQLAGPVTDTTYQAIKDALAAGAAEGEDIPTLAKRIRGVFSFANRVRSTRIARTEVVSAYNGSSTLVAGELGEGIIGGQEWIATRDKRTREDHADADGQIRELGKSFRVGGEALAYPGDPSASAEQVVNCRCTVGFLTPEEMRGRPRSNGRMMGAQEVQRRLVLVSMGRMRPDEVAV